MKRLLVLVAFLFLLLHLSAQGPAADSLNLSQAAYGNILGKLESLEEDGVRNADLYFNLGVCHYQLGRTGAAVLYFLRALNLNSAHQPARANLAYLNSLRPDGSRSVNRSYLARLFLTIYDFFSLNRLAVIVLILALLFTLALHWLLHYPPGRERGLPFLAVIIVGLLFLAFASALLVKNHRFLHNAKVVVMRDGEELLATENSGQVLQYLPEGSILTLEDSGPEKSRVLLADGTAGWIANSGFERVAITDKTTGR